MYDRFTTHYLLLLLTSTGGVESELTSCNRGSEPDQAKERERETGRQTDRERQRESERDRERERERVRETERE